MTINDDKNAVFSGGFVAHQRLKLFLPPRSLILPPSKLHRIASDLRAALARVHEAAGILP